jgi:hypothetical protein
MKTIVFLFLFFISFVSNAQDTLKYVEKDHFKLFVGVGASFVNTYEINRFLSQNNIETIVPVDINATAGIIFYNDFVDIDLGYELFASGKSNETTRNRVISNGVKLRAHYVFQLFKDFELGTGFNISYGKRKLSIFYTDYSLDFNDLDSGLNGNQFTLFLEKAYLGPSVSFKIKDTGRNHQQTKITFAYEFSINNKPWHSDALRLQNTIHEKNRNQFLMNIIFCL